MLIVTPGPEVAAAPSPPDGMSAAGGVDEGMTSGGAGAWRPRLPGLRTLFGLVFGFAPGLDFVGGRLIGDDERGDDERGDVERGDAELGVVMPEWVCDDAVVVGSDVEGAALWVGRSGAVIVPVEGVPVRVGATTDVPAAALACAECLEALLPLCGACRWSPACPAGLEAAACVAAIAAGRETRAAGVEPGAEAAAGAGVAVGQAARLGPELVDTATGIATAATAAVDPIVAATCVMLDASENAPARREIRSNGQKIRPASLPRLERTARANVAHGPQWRRWERSVCRVRDGDLAVELLLDERAGLGAHERLLAGLELLAEHRAGARQQRLDGGRGQRHQVADLGARHTAEVAEDQRGALVGEHPGQGADDLVGRRSLLSRRVPGRLEVELDEAGAGRGGAVPAEADIPGDREQPRSRVGRRHALPQRAEDVEEHGLSRVLRVARVPEEIGGKSLHIALVRLVQSFEVSLISRVAASLDERRHLLPPPTPRFPCTSLGLG